MKKKNSGKKNISVSKKTSEACPIETLLNLVGHKWKMLIIRDLLDGQKRFGELKNLTGASQKSLTIHLREMEDNELVKRTVYPEMPPRVEYCLTDLGYSLAPVLDSIAQWGEDYKEYCKLKEKLKSSSAK